METDPHLDSVDNGTDLPKSVDREKELQKIFSCVQDADKRGSFLSLVGPGGHGKSNILSEVEDEYKSEEDVYVLSFQFHSGLTDIKNFSKEFEKKWKREVPRTVTRRMMSRAVKILQSHRLKKAIDYLSAGGSVLSPELSLLSLSKEALPDEEENDLAPAYSELLTKFLNQFYELNPETRLVLLFDEYHKIPTHKRGEFDRLFHSLATELPKGVVAIVASRTRDLCEGYDSPITEIQLGEFSQREIQMYLEKAGFSPDEDQISAVHEVTSGNPYYLKRFSQTALKHGIEDALDRLPENDIRQYLEDAFLNQLEESQEQFLRDICVLKEFREDIVMHLTGESRAKVRRRLQSLHRNSVIEEIGTHNSAPVYQPHDFLQEHLNDATSEGKLNQQHRMCASFYLRHLDQDLLNESVQDFVWALIFEESPESDPIESFAETTAECFASGSMFDTHIKEISSDLTTEDEVKELLRNPDLDEERVLRNLRFFYSDDDEVDLNSIREEMLDNEENWDFDVIDLETSTPEKQLLIEVARCVRIFGEEDINPSEVLEILKESKERTHKISMSDELNIVGGWVYLLVLATMGYCYSQLGHAELENEKWSECSEFLNNHYGLDSGDKILIKNMMKVLNQRFRSPTNPSKGMIESDPETLLEQSMSKRGAFGGMQEGINNIINGLVHEFYEIRDSNQALDHDRHLVEQAIQEIATYFEQEGNPSLSAFVLDSGKLLSAFLSTTSPDEDRILSNFKETEAHRQIELVISSIEE